MTLGPGKLGLFALACGLFLQVQAGGSEVPARAGARLAQRLNPAPIPGGLPGVAPAPLPAPAPQQAPNLPLPAPPLEVVPPPPPPALKTPDAGGAEGCECHAEVEVPVYEMGRIVRWQRERRLVGRHPQCCRK